MGPNFTVSSLSPGLQAADTVAFLTANYADRSVRPELGPYLDRLEGLMFELRGKPCVREAEAEPQKRRSRDREGQPKPLAMAFLA